MRNRCCAVVAFGTRGDVQPLALLAWQLQHEIAKSDKNAAVTCITHHQHQVTEHPADAWHNGLNSLTPPVLHQSHAAAGRSSPFQANLHALAGMAGGVAGCKQQGATAVCGQHTCCCLAE